MSRAFRHHHGAEQSIGEDDGERERKSWEASAREVCPQCFLGFLKPRSEHPQPELFGTGRYPAQKLPFRETAGIGRQAGVEARGLYAQSPPDAGSSFEADPN